MAGQIGNKGGGRKKLRDEIALIKYYESLLPKVFSIVSDKLENGTAKEKLWALEWIKTGIVKMIPQVQKIGGDKDNQTAIPISILNGITQKNENEGNDKGI